jgi:hypothetical protein
MMTRLLSSLVSSMMVASWSVAGAAADPLYEVQGADRLGWAVSGVGDVSGDTVPDFAAGAPDAGPDFGTGEVRVFSGADGLPVAALDGQLQGLQGAGFLGSTLGPAGDVDGDGTPDILAGAPSVSTASALPGYVVVFSGATAAVLLRVDGTSASERFGDAVASVGDVDGDDVPDVLVGAPGGTGIFGGSARLHSGADGALIRRHDPETPNENFGDAVAALGDINGDGAGDYAIGAPRFGLGTGVQARGYVKVFSGADGGLLATVRGREGDQLGWKVAGPGDLNGDARPDVLASGIAIEGRGGIRGFSVAGGRARSVLSVVWPFEGNLPFFGTALAGVEDVTGDGLPDVAVGAEGEGLVAVLAGRSGLPVFAHFAADADVAGDALASGGDMTGDGLPELVAGAWGTSIVRVFSLSRVTPPKRINARVTFTPAADAEGTATFSAKGKKVVVKFKFAGLPAGVYAVHLEDGPGSGSFVHVADVEVASSGKAKLALKSKVFAPAELRVLSLGELAGRAIELRGGGGTPVLRATVPAF